MSKDSEFDLIHRYFQRHETQRDDVVLGVGDDCALLHPPAGQLLAVSTDLLAENVHFFADADPEGIGHKALAVNLSDLAAQGAEPAWGTLALALSNPDHRWLAGFSAGLFALAEQHGLQLVGGDTTRGPTTIAITVMGFVPAEQALRRDAARPGDSIWVTGTLGDAGLGLALVQERAQVLAEHQTYLRHRLERPTPRINAGLALRGVASAAIDVSDGLAQDLGHILAASGVSAVLDGARLPMSTALASYDEEAARAWQLAGGDDYELCFTVPQERLHLLRERAVDWDCPCTEIGEIGSGSGLWVRDGDSPALPWDRRGYDHFYGS